MSLYVYVNIYIYTIYVYTYIYMCIYYIYVWTIRPRDKLRHYASSSSHLLACKYGAVKYSLSALLCAVLRA